MEAKHLAMMLMGLGRMKVGVSIAAAKPAAAAVVVVAGSCCAEPAAAAVVASGMMFCCPGELLWCPCERCLPHGAAAMLQLGIRRLE